LKAVRDLYTCSTTVSNAEIEFNTTIKFIESDLEALEKRRKREEMQRT
jgi:hypothetical protein